MTTLEESRAVAEAARETEWNAPSFAAELFLGNFRPDLIEPYPFQSDEDRKVGDEYCARLRAFLEEHLDADAVDETREVPRKVLEGLAELGAFGMKIPKEYGGLGMSQVNYNRAIAEVASHCASTAVWLSAHQSIGAPQPLKLFGTEEQKRKYLPRLAKGAISAFALTEPGVGSDPARMKTTARKLDDGWWEISGEKLWCTNGPVAEVIVVMARTSDEPRRSITAFLVETRDADGNPTPGFSVVHRCDFMGIRGIQNGLLRFDKVRVPPDAVLGEEGRGLKLALVTLNTGRLTLPAAAAGIAKRALTWAREWAATREQWGRPIGRHEAISVMLAEMVATTYAVEAVTDYAAALADRGGADIRLEAAIAKMFGSEATVKILDRTLQIRGGRGYEKGTSLAARGEENVPVERAYRDARINTIIEGSSEIMRLFIAREALDPHLRAAGDLVLPKKTLGERARGALRAAAFYAWWYPTRYAFAPTSPGPLSEAMSYVGRASRRLARAIFHAMLRHGPALEKRQMTLFRLVEVGADLTAIAATVARARADAKRGHPEALELARHFYRIARARVEANLDPRPARIARPANALAERFLSGAYRFLEK